MSKLSTHQIRAMVAKIEATIGTHEARPGTARNVAELEKATKRLESYRAELAEREAQEAAQDAEQDTSHAIGPDPHSLTIDELSQHQAALARAIVAARRDGPSRELGTLLETLHAIEREIKRRRNVRELEAEEAAHEASTEERRAEVRQIRAEPPPFRDITKGMPLPDKPATEPATAPPRRDGHSRKRYAPPPPQREIDAAKWASKATVRAEMTGEQQRATIRTEPDPELAVRVRELLRDYTSGTVIDMVWATDRELFEGRMKARTA
jgi:hypothetical protein